MLSKSNMFSRKIRDTHYDTSSGQLSISFDAGISKVYLDVPPRVYEELSKSANPNQYYNDKIDGQFPIK